MPPKFLTAAGRQHACLDLAERMVAALRDPGASTPRGRAVAAQDLAYLLDPASPGDAAYYAEALRLLGVDDLGAGVLVAEALTHP